VQVCIAIDPSNELTAPCLSVNCCLIRSGIGEKRRLESSAEDVEECQKTGCSYGDAELQQQAPVG
jgi:hypothetical protein